MDYPKEFVKKVKREYPDWQDLHEALDAGNDFLGRLLDDSRHFAMKAEEIIAAFEEGCEYKVKRAAEKAVRRTKLYVEWGELYKNQ